MKHESYGITGHGRHPTDSRRYEVYAADPCNEFPGWAVDQCTTRRDLEKLRDAVAAKLVEITAEDQEESDRIEAEEIEEAERKEADADPAGELPTEAEPFRGARGVPVDDGGQQGAAAIERP